MTHKEYLQLIDEVIEKGKYKDNWQSLSKHKMPEWYYRDKFGIFIHWGIYSVPAYGSEWYSRSMYDTNVREYEYHRKTYGKQSEFGYKDFIPMFRAEKFDAKKEAIQKENIKTKKDLNEYLEDYLKRNKNIIITCSEFIRF